MTDDQIQEQRRKDREGKRLQLQRQNEDHREDQRSQNQDRVLSHRHILQPSMT